MVATNTPASYVDFFGSSSTTAAIGNQANSNYHDPSNLYYAPALLAWSKKISLFAGASSAMTDFFAIDNIVIQNSTNSNSAGTVGSASTDYDPVTMGSFQFTLPIRHRSAGTLNIGIVTPVTHMTEINSGSATLPEYVMYRSRYRRTLIQLHYAHPLNQKFSLSVGMHIGFQVGSNVNTQISLRGTSYGSAATMRSKVNPSVGGIISTMYRWQKGDSYFTYQQEMKSHLVIETVGQINDPAINIVNIRIETMIYYDPHIFRLGHTFKVGKFEFMQSLEYQIWKNYRSPVIRIVDQGGGVLPSDNFEAIKPQNIIVPRVGTRWNLTDKWSLALGALYRPTPLEGNFSGPGNSIDTDKLVFATGPSYTTTAWSNTTNFGLSFQYHHLKKRWVSKSANQENGNPGDKIGAGGYQIGGKVLTWALGVTLEL